MFDDFLAPRANREAVPVFIDPDGVHSSRQAVCRGKQQVEDGVSQRTLFWEFLPDIIGILMADAFEYKLHFIITSAL